MSDGTGCRVADGNSVGVWVGFAVYDGRDVGECVGAEVLEGEGVGVALRAASGAVSATQANRGSVRPMNNNAFLIVAFISKIGE